MNQQPSSITSMTAIDESIEPMSHICNSIRVRPHHRRIGALVADKEATVDLDHHGRRSHRRVADPRVVSEHIAAAEGPVQRRHFDRRRRALAPAMPYPGIGRTRSQRCAGAIAPNRRSHLHRPWGCLPGRPHWRCRAAVALRRDWDRRRDHAAPCCGNRATALHCHGRVPPALRPRVDGSCHNSAPSTRRAWRASAVAR